MGHNAALTHVYIKDSVSPGQVDAHELAVEPRLADSDSCGSHLHHAALSIEERLGGMVGAFLNPAPAA